MYTNDMQILKEEIRKEIQNQAMIEFDQYGYQNSSMRRIATNSGISVGNIYRYYKSKDDLITSIVQPVLDAIEKLLLDCTNGAIGWSFDSTQFNKSGIQLEINFEHIAKGLVELEDEYEKEMNFILKENMYRDRYINWLSSVIASYISQKKTIKNMEHLTLLSSIHARIMIDAAVEVFMYHKSLKESNIKEEVLIYQNLISILSTMEEQHELY